MRETLVFICAVLCVCFTFAVICVTLWFVVHLFEYGWRLG